MNTRLSVPPTRKIPPRPLTEQELATYTAIADILCHGGADAPPPSGCAEFPEKLALALATRHDVFDVVVRLLAQAPEDLATWLRRLHAESPEEFVVLSTVAAGAYLLVPRIRAAIGYPGQRRDPAGLTEAADELEDGILDPVLERGHFYVPTHSKGV